MGSELRGGEASARGWEDLQCGHLGYAVVAQKPCFATSCYLTHRLEHSPQLSNEELRRRHASVFALRDPDRKSLAHTWINCFLPNGLAKYVFAPLCMASSNLGLS